MELVSSVKLKKLKKQYDKAVSILTENREKLDEIALYLYHNETVSGKEFMEIFREVEGISEEDTKATQERIVMNPVEETVAEGPDPYCW